MTDYYDKKHTGGADASKGFNFQDLYTSTKVLECICDKKFQGINCEGNTDVEFMFEESRIHMQAKSGSIGMTELREIFDEFNKKLLAKDVANIQFVILSAQPPKTNVESLRRKIQFLQQSVKTPYTVLEQSKFESDFLDAVMGYKIPFLTVELAKRISMEQSFSSLNEENTRLLFRGSLLEILDGLKITPAICDIIFNELVKRLSQARQIRGFVSLEDILIIMSKQMSDANSDVILDKFNRFSLRNQVNIDDDVKKSVWVTKKGIVKGTVRILSSERSVEYTQVYLYGKILQNRFSCLTLATGSFEFLDVPVDIYKVHVQAQVPSNSLQITGRGLTMVNLMAESDEFEITAGETIRRDISIANQGAIFGRVINTKSKIPIPGATITILGSTPNGGITDEDGVYSISYIPTGNQLVSIEAIGYYTAECTIHVQHLLDVPGEQLCNIELNPGELEGAIIFGIVTQGIRPRHVNGPPVESAQGALVQLINIHKVSIKELIISQGGAPSEIYGNYHFEGVEPGEYTIQISKQGYQSAKTSLNVESKSIFWSPVAHLYLENIQDMPKILNALIEKDNVSEKAKLPIRVQLDRPTLSVGVELRGNGVGQSFPLQEIDPSNHVWGLDYEINLNKGTYAIINIQINDFNRLHYVEDRYIKFQVI